MKGLDLSVFGIFWDWYYTIPFQVFDFWRDRAGELSFSCFISYAAEDYDLLDYYLQHLNNATLAEFFLIDPNLLFSYAFPQFYYDPDVREFIRQNGCLYTLLEEHAEKRKEQEPIDTVEAFLNFICEMPVISFFCNIFNELLGNPAKYGEEWIQQINAIITECGEDFLSAVNKVLSEFSKKICEMDAIIVSEELAPLLCPILPYIVPDILSKIKLIKAYNAVKAKKCPSYSKKSLYHNLLAELYLDGKHIASTEVKPDGFIVFKIPKQQYKQMNPKEHLINVMGLQIYYKIPELKITEDWEEIFAPILRRTEDWEEVFTAELRITEDWEEVFTAELRITEDWEETFTAELRITEDWEETFTAELRITEDWEG